MISVVEEHRDQIAELCQRHGIARLDLFGSAARADGDALTGDIDFFHEFDDDPDLLADRFFGLKEDLEALLGRPVDLVSERVAENPYFLQVANQHRMTLYAA